eukprot:1446439-Prymnesium_polylepis.1
MPWRSSKASPVCVSGSPRNRKRKGRERPRKAAKGSGRQRNRKAAERWPRTAADGRGRPREAANGVARGRERPRP